MQFCADRFPIRVLQLKTGCSARAFNMVEILVALALLGFGLYASAEMITSARKTSTLTRSHIQANALAQLKLEELRCAAAAICETAGAATLPDDLPSSGTIPFEQNPKYAWRAHLNLANDHAAARDLIVRVGLAGTDLSTTATALAQVHGIVVCAARNGGAK
jgi:type II secretory pathway pseudopilin PulG